MVDDIELYETPANDLTILNNWCGDIINNFEYHAIPTDQVAETAFGVVLANYGYNDNDATATFTVNGTDVYTATGTIPAGTIDTLWTAPFTPSAALGNYDIIVTVPADDELSGNTATNFYEITDIEFGQNSNLDMFQRTFNSDQEVAFGCLYDIRQDAQAGGVNVLFGSNTDAGLQAQVFLYEVLTSIQDLSEVAASEVFTVTQAMIDNGTDGIYTTIGFNDSGAQDVVAGTTYVAEIRKYESTDRMYLACNYWDDDFGVANYGPFGTGGASNWFNGWDFTPAVRLILDPSVAVEEVASAGEITGASIYPNPADDNANISFNLLNNNNVKVIVRDMTGRLVSSENFGNRTSGQNTINLNVSSLNAGIYSVTVVAGSSSFTSEIVVR
jgi:hypothetical protein